MARITPKLPKVRWPHVTGLNHTKLWLGLIGSFVLVYLVTFGVVAHAAYTTPTPSKTLRNLTHYFPIPAVRIGTNIIWMDRYMDRYAYIDSYDTKTNQPNVTPQTIRDEVIDYLVETVLIQNLANQQHVTVSQNDINSAYQAIVDKPGVNGSQEVTQVLQELYGMTTAEFKQLIGEQLLRERVEQQVFVHVHARQILVSTEAQADDLDSQIKNGVPFESLVSQYSEDTATRDNGGDLGEVGRGSGLPKSVEDAIFALPPDAAPVVVQSNLGWHVIDTEGRTGSIDENFADWLTQQKQAESITIFLHSNLPYAHKTKATTKK